MEFEWNIFPGFTTLQLVREVQEFLSNLNVQPEDSTGRIIFMSMFNDISWRSKDNVKECELSAQLVSFLSKMFTKKMVIPRTWIRKEMVFYSRIQTTRRMGQSCGANNDKICRKRTPSLPIHESIIPKLSIHFCANGRTVETVFTQLFLIISSVFTEQSQICVKNVKLAMSEQGDLLWTCVSIRKKISSRTLVIPRIWVRNKVVFH